MHGALCAAGGVRYGVPMRWVLGLLLAFGGVSSAVVGCSDGDETPPAENTGPKDDGKEDQVYPEAVGPALAELKPGWNTVEPGGATICSKGDPFKFFVRPGATDKVVIEFSGGGACWSDATCPLADTAAIFTSTVDTPVYVADESKAPGLSNHARDDNPIKDWTHIFIGYCTGDVHAGDNVKTYINADEKDPAKKELVINHKGAANTRAVLSWVFKNFSTPQQLLMTGCSAGGYGATFWSPHVKRHYKQTKIYHFSDSAAGVVSPSFFSEINDSWKPQGVYPTYIPGSDPSIKSNLSSFYNAVGSFFPDMPMTQFNTRLDGTQALYFNFVTGEKKEAWSRLMLDEMTAIRTGSPGYRAYLADGDKHCVIDKDDFYTTQLEGKTVASWLGDLVADRKPADLSCPDCK
jgi:hypothetical protein